MKINIGEALIGVENWPESGRNLRQAIEVLKVLPAPGLGQAYDTYARLLETQSRFAEAESMRDASIAALLHALGENNVEVAKQMEKKAALFGQLNRRTEQDLY